jgi:hypothetical protein
MEGLLFAHGLNPVGRFADQLHAGFGLEERAQPFAHNRMVVRDQDSDRFAV